MVTVRLSHILLLLLLNLFSPRWFAPDEASGFCSKAVTDSGMRASTYSLGSICLGSLLTALLQVSRFGLERKIRGHLVESSAHSLFTFVRSPIILSSKPAAKVVGALWCFALCKSGP